MQPGCSLFTRLHGVLRYANVPAGLRLLILILFRASMLRDSVPADIGTLLAARTMHEAGSTCGAVEIFHSWQVSFLLFVGHMLES